MNRRERRRENIHQKTQTLNMTRDQLIAMQVEAHQEGILEGKKAGIRVAVETCMAAYSLVLAENEGMTPEAVNRVFDACNREVFRQLAEKQLDLADIPAFARNYGVAI